MLEPILSAQFPFILTPLGGCSPKETVQIEATQLLLRADPKLDPTAESRPMPQTTAFYCPFSGSVSTELGSGNVWPHCGGSHRGVINCRAS